MPLSGRKERSLAGNCGGRRRGSGRGGAAAHPTQTSKPLASMSACVEVSFCVVSEMCTMSSFIWFCPKMKQIFQREFSCQASHLCICPQVIFRSFLLQRLTGLAAVCRAFAPHPSVWTTLSHWLPPPWLTGVFQSGWLAFGRPLMTLACRQKCVTGITGRDGNRVMK